jgi:glycosyltransferase involved in cell wall biosynthesis
VATIHHGIDLRQFAARSGARDYLLFFGRIHPDKGTAEAIEVARRAGRRLIIAGIVQDRGYFARAVEPHIDGDRVQFIGAVGPERKSDLLGGARALLHLINFDEPFGFSVVEAMACGTPVIASKRGSMPEIVLDGRNGYLVDSVEAAVEAVHASVEADAAEVRASVESRFDSRRMVDEYIAVYRRVLALAAERRT